MIAKDIKLEVIMLIVANSTIENAAVFCARLLKISFEPCLK
jgi:hypothetical protein